MGVPSFSGKGVHDEGEGPGGRRHPGEDAGGGTPPAQLESMG